MGPIDIPAIGMVNNGEADENRANVSHTSRDLGLRTACSSDRTDCVGTDIYGVSVMLDGRASRRAPAIAHLCAPPEGQKSQENVPERSSRVSTMIYELAARRARAACVPRHGIVPARQAGR